MCVRVCVLAEVMIALQSVLRCVCVCVSMCMCVCVNVCVCVCVGVSSSYKKY